MGTMHVRDVDDGSHEVLAEFPHETVDTYKTVFGPDCFRDSFSRMLPVMCWQHDLKDPIGRAVSAQVLPHTNEIRGRFSNLDDVPSARRAFSQLSDGTLTDFSFGFKGAVYQRAESLGRGVRRIAKAVMPEFSPVTIGSIPGAQKVAIREDGTMPEFELEQLIEMRRSGIITPDGFAVIVNRDFPSLAEHIVVRDTGSANDNTGQAGLDDSGTGVEGDGMDDQDVDDGDVPQWTATDAGLHSATGPNGETMAVSPAGGADGNEDGAHVWVVLDSDGDAMGSGSEQDIMSAKKAAEATVATGRAADFTWEGPVTADAIRAALEVAYPDMAEALTGAAIHLVPEGEGPIEEGSRAVPDDYDASLVIAVDEALDSAVRHVDSMDEDLVKGLPDGVAQAIVLMRAASTAVDMLMDNMGIEDPMDAEERAEHDEFMTRAADTGWSTKPWSDFSQADYTPEQWHRACLIQGDGSTKGDDKLPIREPDGTINANAISAAAGRIGALKDVSDADKRSAAETLAGLYDKIKRPVPPQVREVLGDSDSDRAEPVADTAVAAAQAKLEKRLSRV